MVAQFQVNVPGVEQRCSCEHENTITPNTEIGAQKSLRYGGPIITDVPGVEQCCSREHENMITPNTEIGAQQR